MLWSIACLTYKAAKTATPAGEKPTFYALALWSLVFTSGLAISGGGRAMAALDKRLNTLILSSHACPNPIDDATLQRRLGGA
eukprot:3009450-Rhodomonas_salina.1